MKKIFAVMLALAMVLTMAACGKKADTKPEAKDKIGSAQTGMELYVTTAEDGSKIVVDKSGKTAEGYTLDKSGNIVDKAGQVIVAADKVQQLPAKTAEDKAKTEPDAKTDTKTDTKPAEDSKSDTGSNESSSASGSGSSGSSSGGSSSSGNSGSSSGGSSSDSGSSGSSTPAAPDPTPVHQHSWEPVYKTVEDYETQCRTICVNCGEDITGNVTAHTKQEMLAGNSGQSRQEYNTIVVGEHQEIDYYVCSCGETKAP